MRNAVKFSECIAVANAVLFYLTTNVDTSCRLVYRINVTESTDRPHTRGEMEAVSDEQQLLHRIWTAYIKSNSSISKIQFT